MKYVVKVRNEDGDVEQFRVEADYHIVQGTKMIFVHEEKQVAEVNLDLFVDLDVDLSELKEPEFGKR